MVVLDQALYAKACEVAWKHKDLYAEVLLRLGTFQPIFNLLSIIGKRFQDAGLHDTCTESGIMAEGSVSGVLEGDVQFEFTSTYTRPYCKKVTGCTSLRSSSYDPMVLCIRQVQLCKISGVLRTNGEPSSGSSSCTLEFYGRSFFLCS